MLGNGESKACQFFEYVVRQSLTMVGVTRLELVNSTLIIENVIIRRH
jgi:hypothetical protein